jgi:5-amino-6-(5-phosphoribosylamino)uracil reductase/diaminohydroxyphosphoribosylaminopyrimidine deaminase/5-amino-6-(5-phosphoribosylamino)uracil reductase
MRGAAPDLPWVTIKYAQTLDGRIATRGGESQWISSSDSLVYAHELRACHDAILVGVGTVLRDNPKLTVRLVDGPNPLRVVADSSLRTPPDTALLDAPTQVLIAATAAADLARRASLEARGAQIVVLPAGDDGRVDLQVLLTALVARGVRSVLVEGGAEMITSLLRRRLAHRLVVCVAPKVLGAGVEAVGDLDIARLDDAVTFRDAGFRFCGTDVLFEGDVENAHPTPYPAPTAVRATPR